MTKYFFKLAKKMSIKSQCKHKLGAVIVRHNKVIGFGFNKNKTHPKSNNFRKDAKTGVEFNTIHAELDAILDCDRTDLVGATMYIYREHKNGMPALAKPCKFCQELINRVGIKKVFWSGE